MPSNANVFAEIGKPYDRLFNHRAAIQGEVMQMVREFDLNQIDNVGRNTLSNMQLEIEEASRSLFEDCQQPLKCTFDSLLTASREGVQLLDLVTSPSRVLSKVKSPQEKEAEQASRWNHYMQQLESSRTHIIRDQQRILQELRSEYDTLNKALAV